MPSNSTRNTLRRQWELLKALPSRGPGITIRELTDSLHNLDLGVSRRQIERDLRDLSVLFPIACNDAGKPYGWHWMKGASIELPGISIAEALSLQMVEGALKPLLPAVYREVLEARFQAAKQKLDEQASASASSAVRWMGKVRTVLPAQPLIPPQLEAGVLDAVQTALLKERQLTGDYQAADNQPAKTLTLHPLGLIQRGPVAYLIATTFNYPDVRLYALHRFTTASQTTAKAVIPVDFNIDDYLESGHLQFGSGEVIEFKALVTAPLAVIMQETALVADQEITPHDDKYLLEATLPLTWQLCWWVLSQGPEIEVLGPSALRAQIKQSLISAAAQYN